MRFAQTACQFKGLHLCHQFFNDLMSLFGDLSLNVVKIRDQENGGNDRLGHHPKYLEKLYKLLPCQMAAVIQSRGALIRY